MSDRKLEIDTKKIHQRALNSPGLVAAIVMLGVARDLRDGKIKNFDMKSYFECGSPCCIAGYVLARLGHVCLPKDDFPESGMPLIKAWNESDGALWRLFESSNPSDPKLAARAIERYVLEGADDPWAV